MINKKEMRIFIIILILSLTIIFVIGSNILSFSNMEESFDEEISKNQEIKTRFISKEIEHHIMQVREGLISLSQFPILESLDMEDYKNNPNPVHIVHDNVDLKSTLLYRTDENGTIVDVSKDSYKDLINLSIENKDYFQIPKESNQPYVTSIKQISGDQVIISVPLYETSIYTPYPNYKNNFKGALISAIDLELLYNLYIHPYTDESRDLVIITNSNDDIILKRGFSFNNSEEITSTDDKYIVSNSQIIIGDNIWDVKTISSKELFLDLAAVKSRHKLNLAIISLILIILGAYLSFIYKSREDTLLKLKKANTTLDRYGIKIGEEDKAYSVSDIDIADNKIYLIKDDDENSSKELFLSKLNNRYSGLGIIREDIDNFKKQYGLEKTSFVWLSENKSGKYPAEHDFNKIYNLVEEFVKRSKKSVILIDSLDYILTKNDFNTLLERIYDLKDLLIKNQSIIILSLNTSLLSTKKLEILEKETTDIYSGELKNKINLTNSEKRCLELINTANMNSNMISYKNISEELGITKPTTRNKIDKLQSLGLIRVDKVGRSKSLKITSRGRKLL